ncbi:MAG: D-alanyl-D-alanine carboxypeptidase [Clostridiaceae bacterium]|nr:D-alanyl-D-alanine carboxypeptidase [Clostridiaceae bacterium]
MKNRLSFIIKKIKFAPASKMTCRGFSLSRDNTVRFGFWPPKTRRKSFISATGKAIAMLAVIALLTACLEFSLHNAAFADDGSNKPKTDAVSAMLFDARRGQILFKKTSDEKSYTPLASRIMTTLIILEKVDLETMIIASKEAANAEGATLKLTVGEKYSTRNLLTALLLTGSPDAAITLAEYVGGSEEGFVSIMNEYAANLGLSNTRFTNVVGRYDENQYTTIEDMHALMKYALSNSSFNRLFGTQAKPWYDEHKTMVLTNTNNMFWSYPSTDGGATAGYDADFQSIVTTATKNNMRLVCVLLDVPTKSMYNDSIEILNYGFDNFLHGTLVTAGSAQQAITVEGQSLNLIVTSDVYYVHPKGEDYIKDVAINVDQSKLKLPITKNTVVGMLTFILEDDTAINVELYPDREILPQKTKRQILKERFMENRELVYVIIGLIIIELIMGTYKLFNFIKKKIIGFKAKKNYRQMGARGRK